jgi:hypothetical protein
MSSYIAGRAKYFGLVISLFISFNSFSQTGRHGAGGIKDNLMGKWKAIILRFTDDKDSNKVIRIDLTDPKSIKYFSDTIFYNGLYGKLKAESDTSLEAKKAIMEVSHLFQDMDSIYVTLNLDSTYSLNNQLTVFGFAANGIVFTTLRGHKYFLGESLFAEKQKTIAFNVAKDDNRVYVIVKLTKDTLIIDEGWHEVNGPPIKEITFKKQ